MAVMSPAGALELARPRRWAAESSPSDGRSGPRRGFRAPARAAVIAFAAAALLFGRPASADDTFVVDSFADQVDSDLVDIACQTAVGTCTLRAAVMQANVNPGHTTILLPPGVFDLTRLPSGPNAADSGDLNLSKPSAQGVIRIRGESAAETIVDGGDLDRIFRVEPGASAHLEDLTVRNGTADRGGGILAQGALLLSGVRVVGNEASLDGGGLHIDTLSTVGMGFTDIVGNQSSGAGGGLFISGNSDGVVNFLYGAIRDNLSSAGGGIYHFGSAQLTLQRASVRGNEAPLGGGVALVEPSSTVRIESSTIDGNRATGGIGGSPAC